MFLFFKNGYSCKNRSFQGKNHRSFLRVIRPIIFLCALSYLPLSYSAKVNQLSIKGNQLVEASAIKSHINLKKGAVYSNRQVQKDVKKLFSLALFDDIKVYTSYDKKGQLNLLYQVKERAFISQLLFKGNKKINTDELKELVFVSEYSFLNYDDLQKSLLAIKEKYKEKAYYLAEISYRLKKDSNKKSYTLLIEIKEHSKLLVKRINFIGNRNISDETLKSFMLTKETNILSFLGSGGVYQAKNMERDRQAIQYYYRDKGYLNVQVQDPMIKETPDKKFLYITFSISEGVRFKMGEELFAGDEIVSSEEAQSRFKLAGRDYFSLGALQADMQMISLLYKNKGYAFVEVQPLFSLDQMEEAKVHVSFQVEKGKTYKIRRIQIKGNKNTRDKVVLRRFQIKEGELFSQSKMDLSRQLLQQLAFFEKVDIQPKSYPARSGELDLVVQIKEREGTGEASLAGGYSGHTGLFIKAGAKKASLFGLEQSGALSVILGRYQEYFILNYQNPYFLDSQWNLGFELFNTSQRSFTGSSSSFLFSPFSGNDYQTYFQLNTGFSVSIGRHINNFSTLFLKYKLNNTQLSEESVYYVRELPVFSSIFNFLFGEIEENKVKTAKKTINKELLEENITYLRFNDIYDLKANSGLNSSVSATWNYDKRNDRYYASSGFFTQLSAEYSGLGGNFNWTKIQGKFRYYYPLFWKLTLKNRLDMGWIFSNDSGQTVPFTELFLLGGPYDLRGFAVQTQGPRKRSQKAYEYALSFNEEGGQLKPETFALRPYGGKQKFFYSLELEAPIVEKAGLRAGVFFDLGEANNKLSFDLEGQLRANVGFGVRWQSPFGPISLDWAFPYKPRKDYQEKNWEFQLSFGSSL